MFRKHTKTAGTSNGYTKLLTTLVSTLVTVLFIFGGYVPATQALTSPERGVARSVTGVKRPASNIDKGFITKVRSFELGFLEISNPAGLAYSPADKRLFVVEAAQPSTRNTLVKTISLVEDKIATKELPVEALNPGNITFDSKSNTLFISEPGRQRLVLVKEQKNGRLAAPSTTVNLSKTSIPDNIRGMSSDPSTGNLFFIDADTSEIVTTNSTGNTISQIDLKGTGQTDFSGIAFNPFNNHFYVLSPASQQIFEVTEQGSVQTVYDVSPFNLVNPQSMVFAPTRDTTDNPSLMDLYIADSGGQQTQSRTRSGRSIRTATPTTQNGQIVEFSLTPVLALRSFSTASSCSATLVRNTDSSQFNPPSPDTSGVVYDPASGRMVIVDSEVNEIPVYFTGDNIFETDSSGNLQTTSKTVPFNFEPTGIALDPGTGEFFITEDNNKRVDVVTRAANGDFTRIRQFQTDAFGATDPEGITFANINGQKSLFIAGGGDHEIWRLDPGVNGIFDGVAPGGDDVMTHFDTISQGVNDPEAVAFNDNGFLYVIGKADVLYEFKLDGTVNRICDLAAVPFIKIAGAGMGPASDTPGKMNLFLTDRGIDNAVDPIENDGRFFEVSIPPLSGSNLAPVANAGPDQAIQLPASAFLNGSSSDDGLPNPPNSVTSAWTQQSGPATATVASPNSEDTTVTFPQAGDYVFRLTVDDSDLTDFDDVTVTVLPPGGGSTTLSIPISTGSDDAEENAAGSVITGSTDIDLVRSGTNQTDGLRFNNITIPQGATILDAYIQFTTKGKSSEATNLTLEGEATDNALTFVNNITNNISARPRTTASVSWSPVPWDVIGEAGVNQSTPNLTSIVQEIVNRGGWVSGNSLAIIITGSGKRDAYSFESNVPTEAVLHVEYSSGGALNQPPTASITAPANNTSVTIGDNITFTGTGTDPEDGDVTASLAWSSDLVGSIGNGGSFSSSTLTVGTHLIKATATDSGSLTGTDSITVIVNPPGNTAPTATITAPANNTSVTVGDNITFTGTGTDPEDGDVTASLAWSSDLDGSIGSGGSFSSSTLTVGTHLITVIATDSGSLTGTD
ncbi:MAG TPA: hypothetical protein ENJ32_07310, partial [Crenotrichaceae bacterium]|nr:hypothetical protein [Crenotrichaceae bacterium]